MSESMRTAFIAEDDSVLRSLFREYFRMAVPEMELVGEAGTAQETEVHCAQQAPDLLIIDLILPDTDGLEVALKLKERHPEMKVLIFSGSVSSEKLRLILKSPIEGFLEKSDGVFQLRTAVESLQDGRRYF